MLEWDIIEERPSPWGSPCTLVAKENGSPRFCVDYRHTLNRHIVRKSWPLPNLDSCLESEASSSSLPPMSSACSGNYPSQKSTSTGQHSSLRPASSVLNVYLLEFAMPRGCFNTWCLSLSATWVLSQVFSRIWTILFVLILRSKLT